MSLRDPLTRLPTHEVTNQTPPLGEYNAFSADRSLTEAVRREAPDWVTGWAERLGGLVGSDTVREQGFLANRFPPMLRTFDRAGRRIDEVEYHPAYHALMRLAIENDCHSIAWKRAGEGGAVAHAAAMYLLTQPEQGFCCPITMTHAVVPALRHQSDLAAEWEPRILAPHYDERCIPATEKRGVTCAPEFLYEAMECLGGGGYVEESVLSRLYREAPVNSIWEGSGNVICLDVLLGNDRRYVYGTLLPGTDLDALLDRARMS